jgi:hypothetical protein
MITRRRFVQGSAVAALLPYQSGLQASEPDMKARIAEIIREYGDQGDHRTGTEVDQMSADWLIGRINSLGVDASESAFELRRVQPIAASFSAGGLKVSGVPLFDCLYTDAEGVSGSIGDLGSEADIGVVMSLPFASSEGFRRVHAARQEGKHKAIVVVTDQQFPADGPAILNAEDFHNPFGPPVLQVSNKRWPEIQAAIKASATGRVVAHCDYVDATASNINARIRGADPELPPLVIMTPRSGWWACASERGGGIACFLEMMRAIKLSSPLRDVIFTANTGHELGHTGLNHFLHDNPALIKQASTWIHLGANFAARHGAVMLQYSDAAAAASLAPWLQANAVKPDAEKGEKERPFGEARNIYDGGGRYISILGSNTLFHHPADVWPDAVDIDKTSGWVNAFVQLGVELAN